MTDRLSFTRAPDLRDLRRKAEEARQRAEDERKLELFFLERLKKAPWHLGIQTAAEVHSSRRLEAELSFERICRLTDEASSREEASKTSTPEKLLFPRPRTDLLHFIKADMSSVESQGRGIPLTASTTHVSCYLKGGVYTCETRERKAGDDDDESPPRWKTSTKRRKKNDPSRNPSPSRGANPNRRDEDSEAALAGRMERRSLQDDVRNGNGAMEVLGYPEEAALGFLLRGGGRPPPDTGKAWTQGISNQMLTTKTLGDARSSAAAQRPPGADPQNASSSATRALPPVPTVAALMYGN